MRFDRLASRQSDDKIEINMQTLCIKERLTKSTIC